MVSSCFKLSEFFTHLDLGETCQVMDSPDLLNNLVEIVSLLSQLRRELSSMKIPNPCICVNSWYRDFAHNSRVGGSSTSEHLSGSAVDVSFSSPYVQQRAVDLIRDHYAFGQLIVYDTFIHISLISDKHNRQVIYKKK